ncbi:MAG: FHA domain-containing protein [Planctomycetes bacterium]|nr:FHA domain-containing protein [Planctomycetota bacterium]
MSSENVRKQCCTCGTLHPLTHSGECTSCFGDSWRLWCTVHNEVLTEPTCGKCARDERRRSMIPARNPLVVRFAGGMWRLDAGPVVLGRDDDCDIRVNSDAVSRRHCELAPMGSNWRVRDLGSANGTVLDSAAVTEQGVLVADNALLRLGNGPVLELSVERTPAVVHPPIRKRPARSSATHDESILSGIRFSMPSIDPLAIVGLVLALAGLLMSFTIIGLPISGAALALSGIACKRINDPSTPYSGMGTAFVALLLSILALLLSLGGSASAIRGYL